MTERHENISTFKAEAFDVKVVNDKPYNQLLKLNY